ncbi:hypothetical protein F2Q70_00029263 [Brassica cretica]|uniref:Uncharacterized protein n=1 Tax=Brassica cretica TaxID=69181 RepID=A0A8S9FI55_BRACR|nr:hypothetical protein F2Q70_00029263 [Brassica cretica]
MRHYDITVKLVSHIKKREKVPSTRQGGNASTDSSNIGKVETEGDMEAGKKERARQGVALRLGKMTPKILTRIVDLRMDVFTSASRVLKKTHALWTKGDKRVSPHYDAGGNMVNSLFPDEGKMEFVEQPNAHIPETTVRRQVLMLHFQRAVEYRRMYQPEVKMTPPNRGRGHPRKS